MKGNRASFDAEIQLALIDESIIACNFQKLRLHNIGSDESHLHDLVSWKDDRSWDQVRNSLRSSLTRRLNKQFGRRKWFSEGASRRRVRDKKHFDHLDTTYLPDHPGWKYSEKRGIHQ
jgi:REP element-mobilizing transposase RayT